MRFGFVIDNRRCIGCHACSTACKSENEVPLGVNRTWVKYTETGLYPDVRRHFQVTRCNHCENPPCVRICPVTAMYQRDDGIVEFDKDVCIGCKACIQACPYDAIHIDPETGTAAKCHFCSHRTDIGLEPACVVVCPEHAIIAGDMDDPSSEIARLLGKEEVTVRKPEQGTAPKLFYIDGNAASMHPTAAAQRPDGFMFTDPLAGGAARPPPPTRKAPDHGVARSGAKVRLAQGQGLPVAGPIQMGGRLAEQMIQVGYNAQHRLYWHWQVPAYIVTKDVATGISMLLPALAWLYAPGSLATLAATTAALVFTILTTVLLVFDLDRPERFLSILRRPQWRSWLTRGAFLLIGYTIVLSLSWAVEAGTYFGLLAAGPASPVLRWICLPFAVMASVYTAFLFGQAEGRDLWQHSLLPIQFLVRSVLAGAALLLLVGAGGPAAPELIRVFGVAIAVDLGVTLGGEFAMPHATENAAQAARRIVHGEYRWHFWGGFLGAGRLLPLAVILLASAFRPAVALAALLALGGLFLMEYAFVMAPQRIPNS